MSSSQFDAKSDVTCPSVYLVLCNPILFLGSGHNDYWVVREARIHRGIKTLTIVIKQEDEKFRPSIPFKPCLRLSQEFTGVDQ